LTEAVQQRPGDGTFRTWLAWVQVELRRNSDALESASTAYEDSGPRPERVMARAAAEWQAQQPDQALRDWESAVANQPEWENAHWVTALYSPRVANNVREMQAESERRRKQSGFRAP
jgi:hypothetical protein